MKIAVIGLGNMGQPIARNVLQAGYELTVYNRTKQKTEELVTEGAQAADTPRLAQSPLILSSQCLQMMILSAP